MKSISSGHGQLQMIVSQIREVRTTFKAFMAAQMTLSDDLVKWSAENENIVIQDVLTQSSQLQLLWMDAQKEFSGINKLLLFKSPITFNCSRTFSTSSIE